MFPDIYPGRYHPPVRVILPICVIDELDNKKYTGSDRMSRRADLAIRALRLYSGDLRRAAPRLCRTARRWRCTWTIQVTCA